MLEAINILKLPLNQSRAEVDENLVSVWSFLFLSIWLSEIYQIIYQEINISTCGRWHPDCSAGAAVTFFAYRWN